MRQDCLWLEMLRITEIRIDIVGSFHLHGFTKDSVTRDPK